MSRWKIRRITTVLAAWILTAGLVAHGFVGPDMIVKSAVTAASDMPMSADMPMQGKCNGCAGDEKGLAPSACFAFCAAVLASPSAAAVLYAVPVETLSPTTGPGAVSHADPPDPYPPRPIVLS